ncbi:glycosyltransferase [Olivibacter domesticus]|nr:glycosyltransferase [Olivibacter domesticus]
MEKIFKDSYGTWAAFSDWFRYKLLFLKGGWWTDLDVICIKYLDFKSDYCFASEKYFVDERAQLMTTSALIKSPSNAEYLKEILEYIESLDHSSIEWSEIGPRLLHKMLQRYDSSDFIFPPETFCPINWHEIDRFFSPNPPHISKNTFTIHLWNEMWRRKKIDKNETFDRQCLVETFKRKYQIDN